MSFQESQFPTKIMQGSVSSLDWSTDIVRFGSGSEARNQNWTYPLARFSVPNIDDKDDIQTIKKWFVAQAGALDGFRLKDHSDYKSTASMDTAVTNADQSLGFADGTTAAFQIVKNYTIGTNTRQRIIKKVVTGTLLVAVDGVLQTADGSGSPSDYAVDLNTGIITFHTAPNASPQPEITAGYEFDVPVRFEADRLDILIHKLGSTGIQEIDSLNLVELRNP